MQRRYQMNFLDTIVQQKKQELTAINTKATRINVPTVSFLERLKQKKLHLIAEVKQASPSKGIIYDTFNPVQIAKQFGQHGASCVSVLTDKEFFKGSINDLMAVKQAIQLPVLRKDFIIDPSQVQETYSMGADVMLLILDILSISQTNELIDAASGYGIECLLEVHSMSAVEKLSGIPHKPLVGINNRNLETFKCDINQTRDLLPIIKGIAPNGCVVAESGYSTPNELDTLAELRINAVLIGEGLKKNNRLLEWFLCES